MPTGSGAIAGRWKRVVLAWLAAGSLAGPAAAQGAWSLDLFVDPYPSPYASDWETNPNISSLTVLNSSGLERAITLIYQVTGRAGGILASGRSDPLDIAPGAPVVFTSYLDIAGSSSRDAGIQRQMERTGRVPEGAYQACVTMADAGGFVLGESCAVFTIVDPDPPLLLAPGDGEALTGAAPFFQWTPIQVPPAFRLQYVLQVAQLRPNQTPEEALRATVLHYQGPDIDVTNLQYPVDAQPLEPGARYVWRVVAVDQNGFPPATNGGASEIRTFRYTDGTGLADRQRMAIRLSLDNAFDTAEDPDADGSGESATAGVQIDIRDLCTQWRNDIAGVSISADSPFAMRRFKGSPAVLFRDAAAEKWWISTTKGRRDVLIGGDCAGTKTRTRWIASKDSALQARISAMLTARPVAFGTPTAGIQSLTFGMVVLALGKETVDAPADFAEGQAFLQGHTLDVATGLNTYTILGLRDWGLWWLFEAIGFSEKEVALTGFLGWDASWSLGGAVGKDAGVDLSTERKFLVLRADLPKRQPVGVLKGLFKDQWLSIEVSIGDSLGRGIGPKGSTGYSLDLVGKLIHTIRINDELSVIGSLGLDLAREAKQPFGQEVLGRWDWLRGKRQAASTALAAYDGKVASAASKRLAPPSFEEPETGLDVIAGYAVAGRVSSIWSKEPVFSGVQIDGASLDLKIRFEDKKVTAALATTLTVGTVEGAVKLGASREFLFGPKPDTVALKQQIADAEITVGEKLSAVQGPTPDCAAASMRSTDLCKAFWKLQADRKKLASERANDPSWRVRLSAGHMPLGEVLGLLSGVVK